MRRIRLYPDKKQKKNAILLLVRVGIISFEVFLIALDSLYNE